jgi:hypothetical protein
MFTVMGGMAKSIKMVWLKRNWKKQKLYKNIKHILKTPCKLDHVWHVWHKRKITCTNVPSKYITNICKVFMCRVDNGVDASYNDSLL